MEDQENIESQEKQYTWADLKKFCENLTTEQLTQTVYLPRADDTTIEIKYASEIGEDQYYFPESDYATSKSDFDPDCIDSENYYKTIDDALENEEYYITPGNTVYLFDE